MKSKDVKTLDTGVECAEIKKENGVYEIVVSNENVEFKK